jgi:hypothetical protein
VFDLQVRNKVDGVTRRIHRYSVVFGTPRPQTAAVNPQRRGLLTVVATPEFGRHTLDQGHRVGALNGAPPHLFVEVPVQVDLEGVVAFGEAGAGEVG